MNFYVNLHLRRKTPFWPKIAFSKKIKCGRVLTPFASPPTVFFQSYLSKNDIENIFRLIVAPLQRVYKIILVPKQSSRDVLDIFWDNRLYKDIGLPKG